MFEICPSPGRGLLTVHYVLKDAGVRKRLILPSTPSKLTKKEWEVGSK